MQPPLTEGKWGHLYPSASGDGEDLIRFDDDLDMTGSELLIDGGAMAQ
jgi:hypothetical protein